MHWSLNFQDAQLILHHGQLHPNGVFAVHITGTQQIRQERFVEGKLLRPRVREFEPAVRWSSARCPSPVEQLLPGPHAPKGVRSGEYDNTFFFMYCNKKFHSPSVRKTAGKIMSFSNNIIPNRCQGTPSSTI